MLLPARAVKLFRKCLFLDIEGCRDNVGSSASLCDPSQVRQELRPNFASFGLNISTLTQFLPLPPPKTTPSQKNHTRPQIGVGPNTFGRPTRPTALSFHSLVHLLSLGSALPGPGVQRGSTRSPSGARPGPGKNHTARAGSVAPPAGRWGAEEKLVPDMYMYVGFFSQYQGTCQWYLPNHNPRNTTVLE